MKFILIYSFIFFIALLNLNAQDEPELITDRPDITESAVVVPMNYLQIESGFVYQKQKYKDEGHEIEIDDLIFASTLFRYGITDNIELRFGGEYISNKITQDNVSSTTSGLGGLFIGTKINLLMNNIIIDDLAIILETTLPYGNENFRPEKLEPSIVISASKDLLESLSMGLNLGLESNSSIDKNIYTFSTSISKSINSRLSMYVEIYGYTADQLLPNLFFDTGITYLHKQNLQLDLSAGTIIFNDVTNWFGSLGISIRFPK